jgi:serine/threonine-protein kinase RsbW
MRHRLQSWLSEAGWPDERAERLLLAMNEAVTNAIEHAYRDLPPGPVRVRAGVLTDGSVRLIVTDSGRWRPARPDGGGGRGKGVLMMQECGDDVRIDATPIGTTVTITAWAVRHADPVPAGPGDGAFGVRCQDVDGKVVAQVAGDVPLEAAGELRRRVLAASCGGLIPLVIDVGRVRAGWEGVPRAVAEVAQAVQGVGDREVVVVLPPESPVAAAAEWRDLERHVDIVPQL